MDLFVGNVGKKTTEDELKELFSDYGLVNGVTIAVDWETGESKGYALFTCPITGKPRKRSRISMGAFGMADASK